MILARRWIYTYQTIKQLNQTKTSKNEKHRKITRYRCYRNRFC